MNGPEKDWGSHTFTQDPRRVKLNTETGMLLTCSTQVEIEIEIDVE
jgi:hypothetical protein